MMKRISVILTLILMAAILCLFAAFARAEDYQKDIQLLEAQKVGIQWEYRYCMERMKVLEFVVEKMESEIAALRSKIESEREEGERR